MRISCTIGRSPVREHAFFAPPFLCKNDQFTKTGSEQTWEKLRKRDALLAGCTSHADGGGLGDTECSVARSCAHWCVNALFVRHRTEQTEHFA